MAFFAIAVVKLRRPPSSLRFVHSCYSDYRSALRPGPGSVGPVALAPFVPARRAVRRSKMSSLVPSHLPSWEVESVVVVVREGRCLEVFSPLSSPCLGRGVVL